MNEAGLLLYATSLLASVTLGVHSFKNRYLPVARPLAGLAFILAAFCLLNFLDLLGVGNRGWAAQFVSDLRSLLVPWVFPLWIWMMTEYHLEKRIKPIDPRVLLFSIQPVVMVSLVLWDIYSNGFLSQDPTTAVIPLVQRIGDYGLFRQGYGLMVMALVVVITLYVMIRKQQNSVWGILQVLIYTSMPFVLFALHHYGVIQMRLAAPANVLFLYWVSRQYRMLDVMPIALRNILDKVNSGMLVGDPDSKLLYANQCANSLLDMNVSPKALQRREVSVSEMLGGKFDFSRAEKQEAQLDIRDRKKGSGRRYLDITLQPIFHPKSEKHIGAAVAIHDVTARKEAELELQNFDRQKSKFFAGISHEFRTPLTLSLGNLDDVLEQIGYIEPTELKASLAQVKTNNKRLLNLVNQLLELSQLDSGALQITPAPIQLDSYLPSIVANFESIARKQEHRIHLHIGEDVSQAPGFYFDVDAFDKIILNLISNALKSMPEGGDVYVQADSVGEKWLQLSVRDAGCGIPAKTLPRVFDMFYSHQSNNTAWPQGAGVGLSLVKQLLNQHGAEIFVESREGEGTAFTLRLRKGYDHFPESVVVRHQGDESGDLTIKTDFLDQFETEMEKSSIDNGPVLKGARQDESEKLVLLVEDNAEMRAYIRKHLAMNFRLIEAADGEEGLALAGQTLPDLVLSDVMMPKMNGYDLCKQLKTNLKTSHVPVLLLTAKSSQTEKLEGLELGADDYLSKPFDIRELTLRMSNLINSRRVIKQVYQNNGLQKLIVSPKLPTREAGFLDRLQKYVLENISNASIKVSDLAEVVHMSERSLSRKLKALTGDTPKQMLQVIRLEQAAKLLCASDESITQLSYRVGFADSSHFTRCFKAHFSMTPTEYRKQQLA